MAHFFSETQTLFMKRFAVFTILFIGLYINSAFLPSIFSDKKDMRMAVWKIFGNMISNCDYQCSNNCLTSEKDNTSEDIFKACIAKCNCEYLGTRESDPTSSFFSLYSVIFILLLCACAIYFIQMSAFISRLYPVQKYVEDYFMIDKYQKLIDENE